eukprot:2579381-Alexandrium_andersonii.AAC.1
MPEGILPSSIRQELRPGDSRAWRQSGRRLRSWKSCLTNVCSGWSAKRGACPCARGRGSSQIPGGWRPSFLV